MADAPFRRARRGDPLNGYPSEVYNAVLDLLGSRLDAPTNYRPFTSTEPGVLNSSGAALTTRFQVLKVADPATTQAQNDSEFAEARIMSGIAPAAGSAFVVVQEPLSANVIGRSVLLGITPVKVNLTDTAHRYADCTADTAKLTSAPTGPARVLWTENSFAAGDNQWAVVELLGAAGPPCFVRFTLPSALATTDASKAACTVDGYFGGGVVGTTVTVYNLPASTNYIFSGASGNKGLAVYDATNAKLWITQMQCP